MEDYFTIVVIKRANATELEYAYVPHQWVNNEIVYWPPNDCLSLKDDPKSAPNTEWETFKCKIKKKCIFGKEEAELWKEEYTSQSESWDPHQSTSIGGQFLSNKTINKTNIDPLLEDINALITNENLNAVLTNIGSEEVNPSFQNEGGIFVPDDTFNAAHNVPISKEQEQLLVNRLQTLMKSQQKIEKNQLRMLEMQESTTSFLKLKLEQIYDIIKNLHDGTSTNESRFKTKFNFPLSTVSDVQAFNLEIDKNSEYKKYLINTYEVIKGIEKKNEGKTIANILVDIFFTTEVLAMFSWTGMSKTTGVQKKEVFSSCCGILNFFTEIVLLADSCWNKTDSENLFKTRLLRHARQINEASKKK